MEKSLCSMAMKKLVGIQQKQALYLILNCSFYSYSSALCCILFLQGSPQWIEILFNSLYEVKGFEFQFQGGFVGQACVFQFYEEQPKNKEPPRIELNDFYPEDVNSVQIYSMASPVKTKFIRILFNKSTDFFGRVIVYKLKVL